MTFDDHKNVTVSDFLKEFHLFKMASAICELQYRRDLTCK